MNFKPLPLAAILILIAGCGDEAFKTAPVSGVVTLDGAPLEKAAVVFAPQRQGSSPLVGPGSIGVTDADGRYQLQAHDRRRGAVVGPHTVSISTYEERPVDLEKSDAVEVVSKERVPKRYRSPSELKFIVPTDGSDEANFDLSSR
jgi:hypothetical protein